MPYCSCSWFITVYLFNIPIFYVGDMRKERRYIYRREGREKRIEGKRQERREDRNERAERAERRDIHGKSIE